MIKSGLKDASVPPPKPANKPLPHFPAPRRAPPPLPAPLDAAGLSLRAATMSDIDFLHTLYRALHAPAFALAPWSPAEREAVIREQFELQHRHLLKEFPRADYWIVERARGGAVEPIGRYYLNRVGTLWRAMDMGFLPGKRGYGGALLNWTKSLVVAAGACGFDFHVAHDNTRARQLYLKMGFRDIDPPLDFHQRMIWETGDPR